MQRDIALVMSTILDDWLLMAEPREQPSQRLLQHLARMELELIRNATASPFFRAVAE
jgi:hypothetical protein